jgi:hypothetical protein
MTVPWGISDSEYRRAVVSYRVSEFRIVGIQPDGNRSFLPRCRRGIMGRGGKSMRKFAIVLAVVALAMLGRASEAAEPSDKAGQKASEPAEKASEPAEKASKPAEKSGLDAGKEAKSAKKQLSDDSADNKKRVKKGAGKAGDDVKRTLGGLFKKK